MLLAIPLLGIVLPHLGTEVFPWDFFQDPFYLFRTLTVIVDVAVFWFSIRQGASILDRNFAGKEHFRRKLALQFGMILPLAILIVSLVEVMFFWFVDGELINVRFFTLYVPVFATIGILITCFYVWRSWEAYTDFAPEAKKGNKDHDYILSHGARETVKLPIAELAYVCIVNEQLYAMTLAGRKYALKGTLQEMEMILADWNFFRANRQFLICQEAVNRFERDKNKKVIVYLNPKPEREIGISRTRVPAFRKWLNAVRQRGGS